MHEKKPITVVLDSVCYATHVLRFWGSFRLFFDFFVRYDE